MSKRQLPHLPREPIRSPDLVDRELWQPGWRCYCCHDSGIVNTRLVQMVIPDYDPSTDKLPLCHAFECDRSVWACTASRDVSWALDWRFTQDLCNELDRVEREIWQQTVKEKFDAFAQTQKLAQGMNMRKRDRTPEEQAFAQQKHQDVLQQIGEEVA